MQFHKQLYHAYGGSRYLFGPEIEGPYEVYFTSHDRGEPSHVHVDRERMAAKIWLDPIGVAYNLGFSRHELRKIERMIVENRQLCLKKWHEHFGT